MLNKKAVRRYLHQSNKRITNEAIEVVEVKVRVFLDRVVKSVNNFKTIKESDVSLFQIRIGI